ncbi:hypothetical protein XELAEV_18010063mg [Xenopus laevis]|uniref:Uncharacterized protein n=1 Tax=Xenopus laevis TaxID=8355 RepID=A0A974I1J9_XENLA|nr:hypothetical protein XELAEV_18010063mg [Xenopus laevis]
MEKSGQNLLFAETWHITESEIEKVLWHNTHTDEPGLNCPKVIYNKLLHLKKREVDLDLHGLFLSDYFRSKRIPRGFRIKNVPTIGRQNPDLCRKWIGVLNRCSLDLMVLVIEEVSHELCKVRKEILTLETAQNTAITEASFAEFQQKLKTNVDSFKSDLLRFKRDKLHKVEDDYQQHRVYRWLGGHSGTGGWRSGNPRWRKQRSRTLSTVDSSGDSAGEEDVTSSGRDAPTSSHSAAYNAATGMQSSQHSVHFRVDTSPTDPGPVESTAPISTRSGGRGTRSAFGGGRNG